jgi:type I restriction enzyme S subunit
MKPGYKQTEVGVIPEEWDVKLLPEVLRFRGGKAHEQHITETGRYICVNSKFISTDGEVRKYSSANFCPANRGDVLMVMSDLPNGRALAKAYLVEKDDTYTVNQRVCALTTYSDCPEYLFYVLNRHPYFLKFDNGVSQTHLLNNVFQKCPIPVPPNVEEQRAIATALSDVDALLAALDRLIAKKRDLKQTAMQQLLTGQTRLPGFHGDWEVKRLGDFGKCLRGVSYKGDSDLSTHDTSHTKRLLRSNNVQNAVVVTDEVQFVNAARVSSHQILQLDDILICMANGSKALVGKAGIFMLSDGHEYTFGAFMSCFRTNSAEANPTFVFYLFLTARYRDYINNLLAGSSINNLRPSSIESLEFSTPPHPEQTAIASVLSEMDGELAVLEQRREKTRALKQAMMQELLTGRTRLV